MMRSKTELRAEIQAKLSKGNDHASERIVNALRQLPEYQEANTILFYAALPEEVQLQPLIVEAQQKGKTVLLPRISGSSMEACVYDDDLQENGFGISEPSVRSKIIDPENIDVVIVPGLAFDRRGHRLGKGHGYYDKFLANCSAKKIGVALDWQIVDMVPTQDHDQKVNIIITEQRRFQ